jgi:hypothetical protein
VHALAAAQLGPSTHGSTFQQVLGSVCVQTPALQESIVHGLVSSHFVPCTGLPVTGVHVPGLMLHDWQSPVQDASQQKPSAQKVLVH